MHLIVMVWALTVRDFALRDTCVFFLLGGGQEATTINNNGQRQRP
jgi:hypothetical protein